MSEDRPIKVEPLEGEDLNAAQIARLRKAKLGILNKDSKEEK
jgi:hypothetical protein